MTDATGQEQLFSFDAWGQRRKALDWSEPLYGQLVGFDTSITTRGFTGHEMLDRVGLIHMNGRIYNPALGRFLQADPFVQEPGYSQSYNRYAYVWNNPLNATDPSGYFLEKLARPFKSLARGFMRAIGETASSVLGTVVSAFCGPAAPACAAAWGYDQARAFGVSPQQTRQIGAINGLSQWAFGPSYSGMPNPGDVMVKAGMQAIAANNPALGQAVMFINGNWNLTLDEVAQNAVGQYMQYQASKAIERFAQKHGWTLQQFNLFLALNSKLGFHLASSNEKSVYFREAEEKLDSCNSKL